MKVKPDSVASSSDAYLVQLSNANSASGVAYIGGDGAHGFNTESRDQAHRFDQYEAQRFADHFKGWYRGFAGGAMIEVVSA